MRTHHRIRLVSTVAAVTFVAALLPLRASENIDYDGVNKIKQQGLSAATSQVMEVMSYLTDVYGPRLTGSPNVKKAADWAVGKMQAWGLTNVAEEAWTPCPADVAATLAAGQRAGAASRAAGRMRSSIWPPSRRNSFRFPARRPAGHPGRTAWCGPTRRS
jgi:hypothetical protein